MCHETTRLFVVLILSIIVGNVEVPELVHPLGGGDDVNVVTELLLLQVLLGQVLQVALREWKLSGHKDLGLLAGELALVAKLASLAVDLDTLHEEPLEAGTLEQ